MIVVIGYRDAVPEGYRLINTTSRSTGLGKQFSPFFLGPIKTYDNLIAQNMENAWQYSKVYKNQIDVHGNPSEDWYTWRDKGWAKKTADRYPMGKNVKPLYSWWDGIKLSYIEARKQIYIPLYSRAVIKTRAFDLLVKVSESTNIALRDFDGYNHKALGMSYEEVIHCEYRKMGHAFVLAMLIEGYLKL